jgi:hypothetical protein
MNPIGIPKPSGKKSTLQKVNKHLFPVSSGIHAALGWTCPQVGCPIAHGLPWEERMSTSATNQALAAALFFAVTLSAATPTRSPAPDAPRAISEQDRTLLEDLERRSVLYFWDESDPSTGLVLDRANAEGGRAKGPSGDIASLAATGFGLTAICIGAEHGWIPRDQAQTRVRTTLEFLALKATQEHGWFFHWMDVSTGERKWDSEMSSVDTSFLLAGVLTAAQYFSDDPAISKLANQIYGRVDFAWMLDGDSLLLSHGWVHGKGFLKYKWEAYSELPLL